MVPSALVGMVSLELKTARVPAFISLTNLFRLLMKSSLPMGSYRIRKIYIFLELQVKKISMKRSIKLDVDKEYLILDSGLRVSSIQNPASFLFLLLLFLSALVQAQYKPTAENLKNR